MRCQPYGTTADRQGVDAYTLENASGLRAQILSLGCVIARLEVPDRDGVAANVVLGLESVDGYMTRSPHFGAIAGRFANRIAGGRFSIDGTAYQLDLNAPPNAMHGGKRGFHKRVWQAESPGGETLVLRYLSADGEEGFPGNLSVAVTYSLTDANELHIVYQATTDKPTIVNLTNHSYFNLAGEGAGDVMDHGVAIEADYFTPTDTTQIPTGELRAVANTAFDFTSPTRIGTRIREADEQLLIARGYDHNWVLRGAAGEMRRAASAFDPRSGRLLELRTDAPGLQFYTGNSLTGALVGPAGQAYRQGDGFCLETQNFPDAPNHANFPSAILRPGESFRSTTIWRFSVKEDVLF
jgi:aldose 1-epimerase